VREGDKSPPLAEQFRSFGRAAAGDGSPVYEAICEGIAESDELLELVGGSPSGQRRPNLILAAVHFLLLAGDGPALGRHYDTVCEWRGLGPAAPDTTAVFGDFLDFCRARHEEIAGLLSTRATQTNEIGRCAALLPAFAMVAGAHPSRPLGLVDLGASAGLNLLFDRYHYDYGGGRSAGAPGSAVRLHCDLRGPARPPLDLAPVTSRVGLDQRPVDLGTEAGPRWLLACQWPGHLARFQRQRHALALAAGAPGPPEVVEGDMVDDLAQVAAGVPTEAHLCLFHSWVAAYLTPSRQGQLVAAVEEVARRRPLSWVFAESPYETPGLPVPPPPAGAPERGATALVLVRAEGRELHGQRLGDMHPHGSWLRWWGNG